MEVELRSYRANPTDVSFGRLYSAAYPWLKSVGISSVRKYRSLSMDGALDDVVNEGALALSVSARRFTFFCPDCDRVFVNGGDLSRHAMRAHGRRGAGGLVSLSQFARTSARLAMKRTARRLHRPEIPTDEIDREVAPDFGVEDRLIVEIMIERFRERLSARARANLESVLRRSLDDSSTFELLRMAEEFIGVKNSTTKERRMPEYSPEPVWSELNIRTLREAAKGVLEFSTETRTMKTAYADLYEQLRATDRELVFSCQNCNSLIDDKMKRCWACGSVFNAASEEEEVIDAELSERAEKLGIATDGLTDRAALLSAIEDVETKTRAARKNVDLLTLESKRLNDQITETMPDGWSKKTSRQYTAYFDVDHVRRIAVFNRGLKVHFSVVDGFLDGFPDLVFFDKETRSAKHSGRTNYEYAGDTAQYAFDLCKRVMKEYGAKG